ncbi:MAG TPA: TetR family transcriptional regulator [Nitrospirota bacterium]
MGRARNQGKTVSLEHIRGSRLENSPAQDTAARIVAEATRLFAEKGYDGVSIKDISETAGVNIAAVNYHFNSKENLFHHIVEQFLSEMFDSARKTLFPPESPEDLKVRLEIFVRQTVEAIIRQPDVMTIIQREGSRSNEIFRKTISRSRVALIEFLGHASTIGLLADDIDPDFAAGFLIAQIAQGTRRDRAKKEMFGQSAASERYRDQWIHRTLRLFLGGVMAK